MKIVTWNVNGLCAVARKDLLMPFFTEIVPDVALFQETKAQEQQLSQELRAISGYQAFFNASEVRAGYSGTAVYSKSKPKKVTYGMGKNTYDQEGRIVTVFFNNLAISNIYFPNGGQGPERLAYKLEFYEHFLSYIESLRKEYSVVWGGDVNTAHEEIDLARPKENEKNTGFLPEERAWLDEVVRLGWVDTYRHVHPNKVGAYTYWDMKTHARERNVGWRIDYLFISPDLLPHLQQATIHSRIFGSDHCPFSIDLKVQP